MKIESFGKEKICPKCGVGRNAFVGTICLSCSTAPIPVEEIKKLDEILIEANKEEDGKEGEKREEEIEEREEREEREEGQEVEILETYQDPWKEKLVSGSGFKYVNYDKKKK